MSDEKLPPVCTHNLLLWSTHDLPASFDALTYEASVYLNGQRGRPGSIERMTPFAVAAVAFTAQLMIECAHDPKTVRDMEMALINALERKPK